MVLEGSEDLRSIVLDDSCDLFIKFIQVAVEFIVVMAYLVFEGNGLLGDEGGAVFVRRTKCGQLL